MRSSTLNHQGRVLLWLTVILFLSVLQAQAAIQGLTGATTFNFEAKADHIITGEMGFMDTNYYMAEHAMIGITLDLVKRLEGQTQAA